MNIIRALSASVACLLVSFSIGRSTSPRRPTSVDNRVNKLILMLPLEKGHPGMFQPSECLIFSSQYTDDQNSPSHKLASLGYKAVPKLIAAIPDRRATKCPGSMRVGDVALQILEQIAARRFSSVHVPMKESEIAQRKREIYAWWFQAQKLGELAALTREMSNPGNAQAAEALVTRNSTRATNIIREALHRKTPGLRRDSCDYALAISADPAAQAVLKEEAELGPDVRSRVFAAGELRARDPKFVTRVIVSEWHKFSDPPSGGRPEIDQWNVFKREDFIDPLLQCNDLAALNCLSEHLKMRPNRFRDRVVWAMPTADKPLHPGEELAWESLLASELDDAGQASSGGISIGDQHYSFQDPEIGDLAALGLSLANPTRYHYKPVVFRGRGLSQRAIFKNAWRMSVGLPSLPMPSGRQATDRAAFGDTVVRVVLNHESPATLQFAHLARELESKRFDWDHLVELYRSAAAVSLAPTSCVRVLVTRDEAGEGLTVTIDFDGDGTPGGSYGAIFSWSGAVDAKFAFGRGGGLDVDDLVSGRAGVEKCLKAPTSMSIDIDFHVWPSA